MTDSTVDIDINYCAIIVSGSCVDSNYGIKIPYCKYDVELINEDVTNRLKSTFETQVCGIEFEFSSIDVKNIYDVAVVHINNVEKTIIIHISDKSSIPYVVSRSMITSSIILSSNRYNGYSIHYKSSEGDKLYIEFDPKKHGENEFVLTHQTINPDDKYDNLGRISTRIIGDISIYNRLINIFEEGIDPVVLDNVSSEEKYQMVFGSTDKQKEEPVKVEEKKIEEKVEYTINLPSTVDLDKGLHNLISTKKSTIDRSFLFIKLLDKVIPLQASGSTFYIDSFSIFVSDYVFVHFLEFIRVNNHDMFSIFTTMGDKDKVQVAHKSCKLSSIVISGVTMTFSMKTDNTWLTMFNDYLVKYIIGTGFSNNQRFVRTISNFISFICDGISNIYGSLTDASESVNEVVRVFEDDAISVNVDDSTIMIKRTFPAGLIR